MKDIPFQPGDKVLLLWTEKPAIVIKAAGFTISNKSYLIRLDNGSEMTADVTTMAHCNAPIHAVLRGWKEEMKAKGYTHIVIGRYEGKLRAVYFKDHSQYNTVIKSKPGWKWINYWVIS
jgi:hypothetical protein